MIHARIEFDKIANLYPTDVPIAAGMKETAVALKESIESMLTKERLAAIREPRMEARQGVHAERIAKRDEAAKAGWNNSPMSWERISYELEQQLEEDAIIVSEIAVLAAQAVKSKDEDTEDEDLASSLHPRRHRGAFPSIDFGALKAPVDADDNRNSSGGSANENEWKSSMGSRSSDKYFRTKRKLDRWEEPASKASRVSLV